MSEVRDAFSAAIDGGDPFDKNQLDSPLPKGIRPFNHLIAVMKIAPRKMSKGGIILSDGARDGEDFMNNIGRICAIGPGAFRNPWWRERGYIRIDDGATYDTTAYNGLGDNPASLQLPKVGDLIRMSGVRNRQYKLKGTWIVEIDDTQIRGWVDEADVYDYQFWS
jgi:co-chaperonin GroES (HSP10)